MIAFYTWLKKQTGRDDLVGDFAVDTERCRKNPRIWGNSIKSSDWRDWLSVRYSRDVRAAKLQAFREYRKEVGLPRQHRQPQSKGLSLRFKVLARDGYRCQACGRSAKDDSVALEVDHIYPRSKGGAFEIDNLQTLCFECNRGKRNHAYAIR